MQRRRRIAQPGPSRPPDRSEIRASTASDGLQHVCDEVEVASGGGQALRGSDAAVLAEQPSEHLQLLGRSSAGCVWSADELHHASRVGRPARDPFGGHGYQRHLQEPVRIGWPGRRGLDLALGQVLVEGVAQPAQAVAIDDHLRVGDPRALGVRVDVPVGVEGKAVDDVVDADRPGTTGRVVTGVEAECDPPRPGLPGRIGVTVDLVIGGRR